jgi:mannose-1-phosphate guanylyltransferase
MYKLFSEGEKDLNTPNERKFILENYEKAENVSIDYGILEKSDNVFVKKAEFDWNDLGTWGALYDKLEKDEDDNATVRALTSTKDATGNMVFTSSKKLVVLEGIENYIIVDKEDVLMIYPKRKEQEIKELVARIGQKFGDKFK